MVHLNAFVFILTNIRNKYRPALSRRLRRSMCRRLLRMMKGRSIMYAKVNGYRIFFDVEGLQYVPEGAVMRERPVVLVMHGGPGSDHTHFMPDLSPLAEVCQLIYIDDRNCGLSDHFDYKTNSIKQNVEDIEALREYLGLEKVFILGHSYGGMKAQYYVAHHPEHLYGAIIVGTSPNAAGMSAERVAGHVKEYGTPEQYEIWTSQALIKGEISMEDYMMKMLPLYHGKGKFKGQEAYENAKHATYNSDVNQFQFSGELATYDLIPDLKTVDLPCVVIAGEQDYICDVEANREIAEAIPNAEFHVIEGASHEVFADCPEQVFPIITDFIARNFKK